MKADGKHDIASAPAQFSSITCHDIINLLHRFTSRSDHARCVNCRSIVNIFDARVSLVLLRPSFQRPLRAQRGQSELASPST